MMVEVITSGEHFRLSKMSTYFEICHYMSKFRGKTGCYLALIFCPQHGQPTGIVVCAKKVVLLVLDNMLSIWDEFGGMIMIFYA